MVYVAFAHHVPKLSQLDQTGTLMSRNAGNGENGENGETGETGRTKNLTQPKSLTLHGTISCIPTAQDCAT